MDPPRNWTPSNGSPSVDEMQYSVVDPEINSSDDEYQYSTLLSERLTNMSLDQQFPNRFIGKSSGVNLYRTALDLKSEYAGEATNAGHRASRRSEFWSVFSVSRTPTISYALNSMQITSSSEMRWNVIPTRLTFLPETYSALSSTSTSSMSTSSHHFCTGPLSLKL